MKVINKLVAIIIGLAFIALIGLAAVTETGLIEILKLDILYKYIDTLPDWISWGNLAILLVVSVLKILIILLIMFGVKKASRIVILPLLIVVADYGYRNLQILLDAKVLVSSFVFSDIIDAIKNYGVDNLLMLGSFIFIGIFYLYFFIVAAIGKTNKLGARILFLIFGLIPAGLVYGTYALSGTYLPTTNELATIGFEYGIYLVIGIIICIAHFSGEEKSKKKKKVREFSEPKLPLNKLTK